MTQRGSLQTGTVARVGVLGAIAAILFYFPEIPVIGFYKLDFSNLSALLGGFAMGPVAGVAIVLIKDLLGMLHSSSALVGELADFLCSAAMVGAASAWYRREKTRTGAVQGLALGSVLMGAVGALANYYVLLPFYIGSMGMAEEAVIGMIARVIPAVNSLFTLVLFAALPFNLIKGLALSLLCLFIYKRLSPLLHEKKKAVEA